MNIFYGQHNYRDVKTTQLSVTGNLCSESAWDYSEKPYCYKSVNGHQCCYNTPGINVMSTTSSLTQVRIYNHKISRLTVHLVIIFLLGRPLYSMQWIYPITKEVALTGGGRLCRTISNISQK